MSKMLKSKKGITIIALIITIVVLLILAGISVSLVVDKDGLLNSSKETKEEVRAKVIEQKKEVWDLENQLNKGTSQETTLEQLLEQLETEGIITSQEKQEILETGKITIANKTIIFVKENTETSKIIILPKEKSTQTT